MIEMVFFRVDDEFADHHKVAGLPDSAIALWVRAGTWSARKLSDGFVPDGVALHYARQRRSVEALIEAGLWEPVTGGFQFHDWADYNPTREIILERRTVDRVRKRRSRRTPFVRTDSEQTSERTPSGIQTESEGIPSGVRAESLVPGHPPSTPSGWGVSWGAPESAHARHEVPTPAQPVDKPARSARPATNSLAHRAAAEARARAVSACQLCDAAGYIGTQVCDHGLSDAASDETRAAAMDKIRSALGGREPAGGPPSGLAAPPSRSEGAP